MNVAPHWIVWLQWFAFIAVLLSIGLMISAYYKIKTSIKKKKINYKTYFSFLTIALSVINICILSSSALALFPGESLIIKGNTTVLLDAMAGTNPRLLEGLKGVNGKDVYIFLIYNQHTSGAYYATERQIYIKTGAENSWVFQHELGHHIWYYRMNDSERAVFKKIHDTTQSPSEYAKQSAEEDFADTNAFYAANVQAYEISERKQFMDDLYDKLLK